MERERKLLSDMNDAPNQAMFACVVDGKLAGNCMIAFMTTLKERHRARVAIGLLRDYWGLGIGTRMFEEMFRLARERGGIRQIELDYIEGNSRARALYEKLGFRITGVKPDAIRLKDGTFRNEYMMLKMLG
jgi:RimJ/RimL family protein N-acetyltransferase